MISDLSGVEAERKIWQERLDNVSARMNLIEQTGGDRKEWNRLDDIAGESRRALNSLSRAESQIRQGVSSEEALRQSSLEQSRVTRQVAEKQSQVEAGTFKGAKQRAIEARQLRSKTGSTPTPQGEKIIISASGGVRIGTSRYIGNTTIPNTGGMTANDFVRQQREKAIKEGLIDRKNVGITNLTLTKQKQEVIEDKPSFIDKGFSLFESSKAQAPTGSIFFKGGEQGLVQDDFGFIKSEYVSPSLRGFSTISDLYNYEVPLPDIKKVGTKAGEVIRNPDILFTNRNQQFTSGTGAIIYSLDKGTAKVNDKLIYANIKDKKYYSVKDLTSGGIETISTTLKFTSEKFVNPVASKLSPVIEPILNYPLVTGKTRLYQGLPFYNKKNIILKDTTFGEGLIYYDQSLELLGNKISSLTFSGWKDTSSRFGSLSERTKSPTLKNIYASASSTSIALGYVSSVTGKVIPKASQYALFGIIPSASFDVLIAEQKIRFPQAEIYKIEKIQYEKYSQEYEKAKSNLNIGYTLSPKLSMEELSSQIGTASLVKENLDLGRVLPYVTLGSALGFKLFKSTKLFLDDPILVQRNNKLLFTTRSREFFSGKKSEVGTYATIEYKNLVPEISKVSPLFKSFKNPSIVKEAGGYSLRYFDDVSGIARDVSIGRKTIISTGGKEFKWDILRDKRWGIFRGESQTKVGKVRREDVLDLFKNLRASESFSKNVLRLYRPSVVDSKFKGDFISITNKGGVNVNFLRGNILRTPNVILTDGIKSKGGSQALEKIDVASTDINVKKIIGKLGERQRYSFSYSTATESGSPFQVGIVSRKSLKLTPSSITKGAKEEVFSFFSGKEKLGATNFPSVSFKSKELFKVDVSKLPKKLLSSDFTGEEGSIIFSNKLKNYFNVPNKNILSSEVYKSYTLYQGGTSSGRIIFLDGKLPYEGKSSLGSASNLKRFINVPEISVGRVFKNVESTSIPTTISGTSKVNSNLLNYGGSSTSSQLLFSPQIFKNTRDKLDVVYDILPSNIQRVSKRKSPSLDKQTFQIKTDLFKGAKTKGTSSISTLVSKGSDIKKSQKVSGIFGSQNVKAFLSPRLFKDQVNTSLKIITPKIPIRVKNPFEEPTKSKISFTPFKNKPSVMKQTSGLFPVLGRRRGKFKVVGVGRTEKEAFSFGKDWARKTLGVTFKIPKTSARSISGFTTKVSKKGEVLYIEPRGKRLKKKGSEVKEIQLYKSLKRGKK